MFIFYPVFYQTFKTLIHDNPDIDESCKIHYLLSKLDGKAATICSGIQPITENYSIIWKILVDKYQDKRFLANNYLKQILDFKSIQVESTSALNNFVERFDTSVSALKQLNIADLADLILISIALSKLDSSTRKLFEMSIKEVELPTYQQLSEFIRTQAKVLSRVSSNGGHAIKPSNPISSSSKSTHAFTSINATNSNCPICQKQSHLVYTCPKFISLTPSERYNLSKEKSLCLNCLSNKHHIAKCKSSNSCSRCKVRHHTLLHFEKPFTSGENNARSLSCSPQQDESSCVNVEKEINKGTTKECFTVQTPVSKQNYTTLLSTAVVNVCQPNGKSNSIRILLDSGSQGDFLTEKCCKRLGLVINRIHASVVGIGANTHNVRGQVQNIEISSRFNSQIQCVINAWVVDKITDKLPTAQVNTKYLNYLKELPLADNEFDKCREVDGILGAQWFPKLIGIGKVSAAPDLPFGLQTSLGYVIMGKTPILDDLNICQSFCTLIDPPIQQLVEKFFEIEEIPMGKIDSPENIECETHFTKTHSRDITGRYSVALPFKEDPSNLGDSYSIAFKRFISLERKLDSSPQLRKQYNEAFNDYLIQGHMRKLVDNCISDKNGYYLPHHPVFKLDSTTTPLRIVFNASCKTNSSLSLNDVLHTGPKLQTDVLGMFLNFRLNQIAFTADIRQMYRQINLCEEHSRFHRVLYRFESSENIETYELTTLAFGVKPSPFLALRVVRQLAIDEAIKYPQATEIVLRDMYIDDLVSSTHNLETAKNLCTQLVKIFEAGGFSLVKWSSNSKELLAQMPKTQNTLNLIDFDSNYLKVLGMKWSTSSDNLLFSVTVLNKECTKRNILSTIARIFDPLGLLGPVTLYAKLFIRKLWSIQIDWDESPPDYLLKQWMKFQAELPLLEQFSIPRHLGRFENSILKLIGFADACETSYACTVYLSSGSNQNKSIKIVLICAKSKVSPLKVETLARLELCACVMLAKLMRFVLNTLVDRCHITKMFAFTDSMVALHWINASPHRLKTFIANRVAKIQDYLPANVWYHVEGVNNAADGMSRGMTPENFLEVQTKWIFGPSWLQLDEEYWPIKSFVDFENLSNVPEEKIVSCTGTIQKPDHPLYTLIQKHSSWSKLLRSTVIVFQFIKKLPIRKDISFKDLEFAENALIRVVQNIHFKDDIQALKNNRICSTRLKNLSPFLDNDILRVGGRLKHASLTYAHQHPVLLPKKDHFVDILVDYYHRNNLHTGSHLLLSLIRQKYWILCGRGVIRHRIQKCNFCFRTRPKPNYPYMANLPDFRVLPQIKPFIMTGTDYAGPYNITISRNRGIKSQKAYICLFICMTTKALHLELVSDLSTPTFLSAFKRFLARRGPILTMISDQGTNYIGAKSKLDEVYRFLESTEYTNVLKAELLKNRIEWKFNVPSAPHMGGIWESHVKCVKSHLHKILGSQILSYEEFSTVLVQIESLLNSRPLCWLISDPSDPEILTPAHFLTLTPLKSLPAIDVSNEPLSHLHRKQLLDGIVQSFWRRWKEEYLSTLQVRQKWNTPVCPIQIGQVVVLIQDNLPPLHWPLGVIEEVYPGRDGIIRIASVRTKSGCYKRPVVKLCPLPTQ